MWWMCGACNGHANTCIMLKEGEGLVVSKFEIKFGHIKKKKEKEKQMINKKLVKNFSTTWATWERYKTTTSYPKVHPSYSKLVKCIK